MDYEAADRVWCLEKDQVIVLMAKLGIDHDNCDGHRCECDEDELRGILFSFYTSVPNINRTLEIADSFEESFELIQALLESSSGRLTGDIVSHLIEDKKVKPVCIEVNRHEGVIQSLPAEIDCMSTLVVCELSDENAQILPIEVDKESACVFAVSLTQPNKLSGARTGTQTISSRLPFGVHMCTTKLGRTIHDENGVTRAQELVYKQKVSITSPVFRFAAALDAMFDRLYFGWEGNWTTSLESALFELVVAVDDDLVSMVRSWVQMLGSSAISGADDMSHMLECVTLDVQHALNDHSAQAVGRLHQTLVQFVDTNSMNAMMRVPEGFIRATNDFMQAKMDASAMNEMKRDLQALVEAARGYCTDLNNSPLYQSQQRALQNMITCADVCLDQYLAGCSSVSGEGGVLTEVAACSGHTNDASLLDTPQLITLELAQLIHNLKPQGLDLITKSSITNWDYNKLDTMPFIPLQYICEPALLHQSARRLSETMVMDAMNIGSMMGYNITDSNVAESAAIIASMLEVGIAYVTSEGGKLMGLLPMERSMLVLNDPGNYTDGDNKDQNNVWVDCMRTSSTTSDITTKDCDMTTASHSTKCTSRHVPFVIPNQLRKRAKDMHRVFRNNVKNTLSLRINSNIDLAIEKLRHHHGSDCWVGSALQSVWKCMAATSPPQLLIFELWYGEEMIAADYAHPVCNGRSIYVATRFYDRSVEFRKLMPGFMLALVVTKYLQSVGCCVWDLGTSNLCPLMRYKLDLTGAPFRRPEALYELERAHNVENVINSNGNNGVSLLSAGVVIDNITVAHLLS